MEKCPVLGRFVEGSLFLFLLLFEHPLAEQHSPILLLASLGLLLCRGGNRAFDSFVIVFEEELELRPKTLPLDLPFTNLHLVYVQGVATLSVVLHVLIIFHLSLWLAMVRSFGLNPLLVLKSLPQVVLNQVVRIAFIYNLLVLSVSLLAQLDCFPQHLLKTLHSFILRCRTNL